MPARYERTLGSRLTAIKYCAAVASLASFLTFATLSAQAQSFDSGSTGADGPFNPPGQVPAGTQVQGDCTTAPGCTVTVPLREPPTHVFNFTTVTIGQFVTVKFNRNTKNTPVTILASGNVNIVGVIDVSGSPGQTGPPGSIRSSGGSGGPGGFDGGAGGGYFELYLNGIAGDGPGGGGAGNSQNRQNGESESGSGGGYASSGGSCNRSGGGLSYGTRTLLPLLGGSGGGGASAPPPGGFQGSAGGGGGGAILIASSTTIVFTSGTIRANGGVNGSGTANGGGGAGGAIRVIATTIAGGGTLAVSGVSGTTITGCSSSGGFVRLEAFNFTNLGISTPGTTASFAQPGPITLPNAPQLRLTSVAGIAAPASSTGSFSRSPDVVIPATTPNPADIALQAVNIPVGTVVQVVIQPEAQARTIIQSTPLAGSTTASTATASATLPDGLTLITATATFNLQTAQAAPLFINGERIDRIEVATTYGGASEVTYIARSGKRIKKLD